MPGTFSEAMADDCTMCAKGYYQQNWGTHHCHQCSNGTTTDLEGTEFITGCKDRA